MDKSELKPTEIRSLSPRLILFVLNDVVIPVVNVPVEPATVPPLILPVTSVSYTHLTLPTNREV